MSAFKSISASIIQESAIGPASYVVNGSDLHTVFDGNDLLKYADDTYLIIPAVNVKTRTTELSHINEWAKHNNLKLNLAKTHEIIFVDRKRKQKVPEPVEISELQGVKVINILGITITNSLSVSPHVQSVIASCAPVSYALSVLRAHGLCDSALHTIYRSVVIAELFYASCAWEGFANATDRKKKLNHSSIRVKEMDTVHPIYLILIICAVCTSMKVDLFNKVLKFSNTCITPTTVTPRQSYTAIWFTTQSTRQDSTREKLKSCGL